MNKTIQAFNYPTSLVREYDHWVVLLRPNQVTIGSLVIAAKSEAISLGMLTPDAWTEFSIVTKDAEKLLAASFGAEKFNYLALMMKDPNVHFHLIPRYSAPVEFRGARYIDADWPLKTELNGLEIGAEIYTDILKQLKS